MGQGCWSHPHGSWKDLCLAGPGPWMLRAARPLAALCDVAPAWHSYPMLRGSRSEWDCEQGLDSALAQSLPPLSVLPVLLWKPQFRVIRLVTETGRGPRHSSSCPCLSREGEFTVEVLAVNAVSTAALRKQLFIVRRPCQPPPVKNLGPPKVQVGLGLAFGAQGRPGRPPARREWKGVCRASLAHCDSCRRWLSESRGCVRRNDREMAVHRTLPVGQRNSNFLFLSLFWSPDWSKFPCPGHGHVTGLSCTGMMPAPAV